MDGLAVDRFEVLFSASINVEQVYEILMTTKKASDIAILLVEQNVAQALPLADYLYLLNLGRVKAEGPGRDFDNTRVRALIQECLLG